MKRFFFLILFVLGTVAYSQSAFTTGFSPKVEYKNTGIIITVKGTIDTTDELNSSAFGLVGFDKVDFYTYPLTAAVKLAGTSLTTRRVSAFIQASYDNSNWANVDTISNADSVNTVILKTALNLNGYRAPYYRISVKGATTGNDNTTFDIRVYAYRRD